MAASGLAGVPCLASKGRRERLEREVHVGPIVVEVEAEADGARAHRAGDPRGAESLHRRLRVLDLHPHDRRSGLREPELGREPPGQGQVVRRDALDAETSDEVEARPRPAARSQGSDTSSRRASGVSSGKP